MMNEEQFIESQKECASMLGMSFSEYQHYCKEVKVASDKASKRRPKDEDTLLKIFNFPRTILKKRR